MFITLFIDAIFYGIVMLLVLQYYYKSFGDPWKIKTMVAVLGLLATIHIISLFDMMYGLVITNFGNFPALDIMTWGAVVQSTVIYIIAFIAQCFFVKRIWSLSQTTKLKLAFTVPIMVLSTSGIVSGLVDTGLVARHPRFSRLGGADIHPFKMTFALAAAACDISITAALCYLLHRSRTGIQSTESLLNTLIIQAINRGAITSVAAVLYLILYLSTPTDAWFMIALLPMSQHYVISVISMLNSRVTIRETLARGRERSDGISLPLGSIQQSKTVEGGVHISTSVVTWEGAPNTHDSDNVFNTDNLKVGNFR